MADWVRGVASERQSSFPQKIWMASVQSNEFAVFYFDPKSNLPRTPEGLIYENQGDEICHVFESVDDAIRHCTDVVEQHVTVGCKILDGTGREVRAIWNERFWNRYAIAAYGGALLGTGLLTLLGAGLIWLIWGLYSWLMDWPSLLLRPAGFFRRLAFVIASFLLGSTAYVLLVFVRERLRTRQMVKSAGGPAALQRQLHNRFGIWSGSAGPESNVNAEGENDEK